MKTFFIFSLLFSLFHLGALEKRTYAFSSEPIDVVIPCSEKDLETLEECIEGIRANGRGIRRIIVVSSKPLTKNAEWFDEKDYPFSKAELALEIFHGDAVKAEGYLRSPSRIGWILQQLLKLYAPFVIPGISSNVLVLDADVVFLNSVRFMNEKGEPLFHPATELHPPYFDHAARLLDGLKRVHPKYSGVAHHMLLQRPVLEDLFSLISLQHKREPWKAICNCIDPAEFSCISEYEIYFNFALLRTDQARIEEILWTNVYSLRQKASYKNRRFAFIACQQWLKEMFAARIEAEKRIDERQGRHVP